MENMVYNSRGFLYRELHFYPQDAISRVLEDDTITLYGVSMGLLSYQSTMGGTITIPSIKVDRIEQ